MKYKDTVPNCPVRRALGALGGKWRLLLVHEISKQTRRYGELKRLLPDISERMLVLELKSLTDDGLLVKKSYGEVPPRVEYSLSERGRSVLPLIAQLEAFGLATDTPQPFATEVVKDQ